MNGRSRSGESCFWSPGECTSGIHAFGWFWFTGILARLTLPTVWCQAESIQFIGGFLFLFFTFFSWKQQENKSTDDDSSEREPEKVCKTKAVNLEMLEAGGASECDDSSLWVCHYISHFTAVTTSCCYLLKMLQVTVCFDLHLLVSFS